MITISFFYSETLEPEVIKSRATGSQPLCMEQFGRLLNAYRMPGIDTKIIAANIIGFSLNFTNISISNHFLWFILGSAGQDELVCSPPTESHNSEHVIVFANGYVSTYDW